MTITAERPAVEYGDRDAALEHEILRTVVGSEVHGIAIEGTDDRDEMGVYVDSEVNLLGVTRAREDYISRTQPEGARSGPGDTDLVLYSLRKYLRLATKGNPTALLPLFAPEDAVLVSTLLGDALRRIRSMFLTREAVERFLGYMHSQHQRMLGRGPQGRVPNRPELVAEHGWDVKYGSHAVRLSMQGLEVARDGHLTLPMPPEQRDLVLAVKRGEVPHEDASHLVGRNEDRVRALLDEGRTPLPPRPDLDVINDWSRDAHLTHWNLL